MKKLLSLLLITCIFLSGCGISSSPKSGYINICTGNSVMSLDNSIVSDSGSIDTLWITSAHLFKLDENGTILPDLVESYEVSPDGMTYIFHLRDSAWSDGTPITADDFVFSFERIATSGGSYNTMLADPMCIKNAMEVAVGDEDGNKLPASELGIYADDDRILRIELTSPVTFLPSILTYLIFSPVKRSFYESLEPGTYGTGPDTFLCSGAFKIDEYIPGTTNIVFSRNEYYYDSENVNPEGIVSYIITSESSSMEAFKVGDLDIIDISGNNVIYAQSDEKTSPYMHTSPGRYLNYITFNLDSEHANPAISNKNFRLALIRAIDRQKIVDSALGGVGKVANWVTPEHFAFSITDSSDFAGDQELYADLLGHDADEARKYLELAKKELGQDEFTINFYFRGSTFFTKYAQIIQQQVSEILPEVKIELFPLSAAENSKLRAEKTFDLYVCNWGPDYLDPMTYMQLWSENSSFNYGSYKSEEYNALINDCISGEYANDYDKRWEALKEAAGVILNDAAIFPLHVQAQTNLVSSRIKNYKRNANNDFMFTEMEKE